MGCKSFHVVRFDLGPLLLIIGPRGLQCEKVLITRLLLVLEVWNGNQPT